MNNRSKTAHFIVMDDEQTPGSAHLVYAVQLAHHFYLQGIKSFILTESREQACELDELMFSAPLEQFTPHCLSWQRGRYGAAVELGERLPPGFVPLIINLHANAPQFAVKCRAIVDLVPAVPELRELARKRYRQYQSYGWSLNTCKPDALPQLN